MSRQPVTPRLASDHSDCMVALAILLNAVRDGPADPYLVGRAIEYAVQTLAFKPELIYEMAGRLIARWDGERP